MSVVSRPGPEVLSQGCPPGLRRTGGGGGGSASGRGVRTGDGPGTGARMQADGPSPPTLDSRLCLVFSDFSIPGLEK